MFTMEDILEEFSSAAGYGDPKEVARSVFDHGRAGMHVIRGHKANSDPRLAASPTYDRDRYLRNAEEAKAYQRAYYWSTYKAVRAARLPQERLARQALGIPRRNDRKWPKTSYNDALAMSVLVGLGLPKRQVAKVMGVADSSVCRVLKRELKVEVWA